MNNNFSGYDNDVNYRHDKIIKIIIIIMIIIITVIIIPVIM